MIQTVGGKWMRKKDWTGEKEEIVVGSFPFTHVPLNPLKMVYCGWQEGGMKVLVNYMSYLSDYREWSARQRDEYGNGWQSPKTAEMVGESLLDKKAVDETIGKRMEDAGFGYCSENPAGWILEREQGMEKEVIQVRRDRWGRKAFFVIYSILEGRSVGTYRFRKFCFYQDGEDMRVQLGRVGEEMREALFQNIRIEAAWEIPSFRYHLTKDDKERF